MDKTALKALIDKYFDGLTSDAEEAALRRALASPEVKGEEADEARAVMGVFATQRLRARRNRRNGGYTMRYAAAALTLALTAAAWNVLTEDKSPHDVYLSYVNGTRIDEAEPVMAIMASELSAIGEAESSMQQEFNEILLMP